MSKKNVFVGAVSLISLFATLGSFFVFNHPRVEAGTANDPILQKTYSVTSAYLTKNVTVTMTCFNNTPNSSYPSQTLNFKAYVAGYNYVLDGSNIYYTLVSGTPSTPTAGPSTHYFQINGGTLAPGQTKSFTFTLKPPAGLKLGETVIFDSYCEAAEWPGTPSGGPRETVVKADPVVVPPPAQKPTEPKAKVASVAYPATFKANGSTTTDLSNVTVSGAKGISNYILDVVGSGKITFTEVVDLSSDQFATDLAKLDQFVTIGRGMVSLDSTELTMLNKKASITLTGLKLIPDKFVILHDDAVDDAATASAKFDSTTGVLVFDVTGFSEYAVAPLVSLESSADARTDEKYNLAGIVGDLDSKVNIMNNGQVVASDVKLDETGKFSTDITLVGGVNNIIVEATGVSGSKGTQALNVTYNKPLLKTIQDNIGIVVAAIAAVVILVVGAVAFVLYKKGKLPFGKKVTTAGAN